VWPWELPVAQSALITWSEDFIPLATYLEEAKFPCEQRRRSSSSTVISRRPYATMEDLVNTHPTRLLKMMHAARQTFGCVRRVRDTTARRAMMCLA
jgi:hypothetical protein